jgi:DNA polymerase-3 subunit epsilon
MERMKNLKITRPLAFIDLETTGLNVSLDRIVEISILKVHPDGREEQKTRLINPGKPIPEFSTRFHGITDERVVQEPTFRQIAGSLRRFLEDCDISGFNVINFDLPFLVAEFRRCEEDFVVQGRIIVDSLTIFHKKEPRSLQAAYKRFCGTELESAHSAGSDAMASARILDAMIGVYTDLPQDLAKLAAWQAIDRRK